MVRNRDPIQAIRVDITLRTHGEEIGMFTVKAANQTVADAALRPVPRDLFMGLWYEGEVPVSLPIPTWASPSSPSRLPTAWQKRSLSFM